MIKTNELAPTDMEACLQSRIDDLEQQIKMQRLAQLAAAIQAAADMMKPLISGNHGYVSMVVDRTGGNVSSILFHGMGSVFIAAGGVAGPWYGTPSQRTVVLTLPSGQVLECAQRASEVTGAE